MRRKRIYSRCRIGGISVRATEARSLRKWGSSPPRLWTPHRRRARYPKALREPVSVSSRTGLCTPETEIGKSPPETGARNPPPKNRNARNCRPETEAHRPNPRRYRRFSPTGKNQPRDPNLRMAESNSAALPRRTPLKPLSRRKFHFPRRGNARSSPRLFEAIVPST